MWIVEKCARPSRTLNRLLGGRANQTLCARFARKYGHDCLFCRLIGVLTLDRDHCWKSLIRDLKVSKDA